MSFSGWDIRPAITAPATRWRTRCEIWSWNGSAGSPNDPGYEYLWMSDVPVTDGRVTLSIDRPENRLIDITLENTDGSLTPKIDGLWYDKFLVVYKQLMDVDDPNTVLAEIPLGHFMLDGFGRSHFPATVRITGRDFMKKLILPEFGRTHTYFKGSSFLDFVYEIMEWAQIPASRLYVGSDWSGWTFKTRKVYERGGWTYHDALLDAARQFGPSSYFMFNAWGILRLRGMHDILVNPPIARFDVGPGGNLISYDKSADDTRIFNHIIVINEGQNDELYSGRAWNNDPTHPTSRQRIGERSKTIRTQSLKSNQECLDYAAEMLSISALEQFDVNFGALVNPWPDLQGMEAWGTPGEYPWLDVNNIVEFYDGTTTERFSLMDLSIPLGLGKMTGTMKRISKIPVETIATGT